jgi:RNA polymerase sigma factor (sigma-70 family)
VFVKAYLGLERFRSQAGFRTWLHRITVNHCLNHLSRGPRSDSLERPETGVLATERDRPELRLDVQSCLAALSSSDRLVLLLKYAEDLDHHEIAEMLSISVSASKMRVQRAKERFLELYHANDNGGRDV